MTPAQVLRKKVAIKSKIAKFSDELKELQNECTHVNLDKKYKGNTGNYDPGADGYWVEYLCHDCGKFWCTDQ